MFNRRRIPLFVAGISVLVLAASAAAAPNTFTATLTPTLVRAASPASYTLTLTSGATSDQVDKAKIAIPAGFSDPTGVTATTTSAGNCNASTWEADGTLIANGAINLKRPGGGGNANLCPGGALTVGFTATAPATPAGSFTWTPHLFGVDGTEFPPFTGNASVAVDGTAPETTITSVGPTSPTNQTSATFTFTSSEQGSTFECSLDAAAFTTCQSPQPYNGLAGGGHTFQVRAKDAVGNPDTSPASRSWTIDITAPETTITSNGPPSTTNQTSATFTFTSNEQGSTFECSLDGAAFTACQSPRTYNGLPGGARVFRVRAKDPVGNIDASPASRSWTIDLVGAATTILTAPPGSTNSTSASFTFSASEQGVTFECSLEGALFTSCTSPKTYNGLADGLHRFAVRAVDSNQNTGPDSSHTWSVDTRAPRATVTSGPPALSNSRSASFTFSADEPASFQCRRDGGAFAACGSPASYANLAEGAHTFVVVPTDSVGNPGASAAYGWTIDATAPQTTLGSRTAVRTASTTATFRFSASEPAAFECKLDAGRFVRCASPKRYVRLRRTRHSFSVRAIDAAGNRDATPVTYRWTISLRKAISALLAPPAGARVASPPLLRWRSVARASYYNVQLYRGSVKVLSVWPSGTRLQLRARWRFFGREYRLTAGRYRWYVWPRFGRGTAGSYGNVLGQSTFTVKSGR